MSLKHWKEVVDIGGMSDSKCCPGEKLLPYSAIKRGFNRRFFSVSYKLSLGLIPNESNK